MYYLKKARSLFLHIPRTGGTWVVYTTKEIGIEGTYFSWDRRPKWLPKKHNLLYHFYNRDLENIEFVFTFVRRPRDWYTSVWRYFHSDPKRTLEHLSTTRWHPLLPLIRLYHRKFHVWMDRVLAREPMYLTRLYEQYLGPDEGEFCAYIGRTDTLEDDYIQVLNMIGCNGSRHERLIRAMGVQNKQEGTGKASWTPELVTAVEDSERLCLNRFFRGQNLGRRLYGELSHHVDRRDYLHTYQRSGGPAFKKVLWENREHGRWSYRRHQKHQRRIDNREG